MKLNILHKNGTLETGKTLKSLGIKTWNELNNVRTDEPLTREERDFFKQHGLKTTIFNVSCLKKYGFIQLSEEILKDVIEAKKEHFIKYLKEQSITQNDIDEFITDQYQNLATFEFNLETFDNWYNAGDKKIRCECCEEQFIREELNRTDDLSLICDNCLDQAEPIATIIDQDNNREIITDYRNPTEFKVKWVSTDAWRGYYETETPKGWTKIHDDNILAMSEDEKELKKFDDLLTEYLKTKNIQFVKVFCRSSNVFSTGYEVFVKTTDKTTLELIKKVSELKELFRNEDRYLRTALTGANEPENKTDDLLIKCFRKLEKGETLEDIKSEIEDQINEVIK